MDRHVLKTNQQQHVLPHDKPQFSFLLVVIRLSFSLVQRPPVLLPLQNAEIVQNVSLTLIIVRGRINFNFTLDRGKIEFILTLCTMDWAKSLAAINAASLQTFATSAPVNPGVNADNLRASSSLSTSVFNPSKCTLKIEALPYGKIINI